MRIKEVVRQHRRDFTAVYECEHCGEEYRGVGYDDARFHQLVVPRRECPKCGKTSPEGYVPRRPAYPDGVTV